NDIVKLTAEYTDVSESSVAHNRVSDNRRASQEVFVVRDQFTPEGSVDWEELCIS
ncbi:hypothetical protein L9F63_006503, partial [Diploptera punctata]